MDLTTVPQIKERIVIDADNTDDDDVIMRLIRSVSNKIEGFLRRELEIPSSDVTEYFTVDVGQTIFALKYYPISSITNVWNDTDWSYGTSSLVDSSSYQEDADSGLLYIDQYTLISGFRALKVTYSGGLVSDTFQLMSNYPDIVDACERQVAYLFNTRRQIGAVSVNVATGNVEFVGDRDLLQSVKDDLMPYQRMLA